MSAAIFTLNKIFNFTILTKRLTWISLSRFWPGRAAASDGLICPGGAGFGRLLVAVRQKVILPKMTLSLAGSYVPADWWGYQLATGFVGCMVVLVCLVCVVPILITGFVGFVVLFQKRSFWKLYQPDRKQSKASNI
jgi:hypothetical protein